MQKQNPMATVNKLKVKPFYLWGLAIILPIITVIILLLSYFIYNNYTIEQTDKLNQLIQEETTLKEDLKAKYILVKSIPLYKNKINELNQLEQLVNLQFPSSDAIPDLLIQINQLAENSNVTISSFVPSAQENSVGVKGVLLNSGKMNTKIFNLTAAASYIDFTKFIFLLAQFPRVLKIDDVRINRIDEAKVGITLSITIFYSS